MKEDTLPHAPSLNIHIYQSTFLHESRMLKITQSLVDGGVFDRVLIIARHDAELPLAESIDAKRSVRRISTWVPRRSGLLFKVLGTLEWLCRVMVVLLFQPVSCVNCHSLMVLPLGVVLKILRGKRLIYDTHELETETGNLRGLRKRLAKWTEWLCIRFVDETIVVGDGIAAWYQETYPKLSVHTVRNVPRSSRLRTADSSNDFRVQFQIPEQSVICLYQGVLGQGRGIRLLLEAFAELGDTHHLVLMGYGDLEDEIRVAASKHLNIHFHPAVPPQKLAGYTCFADVGICLIENMCLSYYFSMPNKLFEYIQAGIPVVASAFPEMSRVINSNNCGWTTPLDIESVVKTLEKIDLSAAREKHQSVLVARSELVWEQEEKVLLGIYRKPALVRSSEAAMDSIKQRAA